MACFYKHLLGSGGSFWGLGRHLSSWEQVLSVYLCSTFLSWRLGWSCRKVEGAEAFGNGTGHSFLSGVTQTHSFLSGMTQSRLVFCRISESRMRSGWPHQIHSP